MNSRIFALFIFFLTIMPLASLAQDASTCAVYLTGIGCPNCAKTDPVLLANFTRDNPDLVIIEYEIYDLEQQNSETAAQYFTNYLTSDEPPGIPLLIFNKENKLRGRIEVLDAGGLAQQIGSNDCPLPDGTSVPFSELDITELPGEIKIWTKNRVLLPGIGGDSQTLKQLLLADNITQALQETEYEEKAAHSVQISEGNLAFDNAVKLDGWTLQWRGESLEPVVQDEGFQLPGWAIIGIAVLGLAGLSHLFKNGARKKDYLLVIVAIAFLAGFYLFATSVSPDALKDMGSTMPLDVHRAHRTNRRLQPMQHVCAHFPARTPCVSITLQKTNIRDRIHFRGSRLHDILLLHGSMA